MSHESYEILVVDDDETILYLLQKMLQQENHRCLTAKSAAAAMQILEEKDIDLILTDINMPQVDGLQFLRQAQLLKPHTPVMIMTADPNVPRVKQALQEGALDFLEKPFDLDRIFQTITKYAEKRLVGRVISLKHKSMLLVNSSGKKEPRMERALLATRCRLTIAETEDDALKACGSTPFDLVIHLIGAQRLSLPFANQLSSLLPEAKSICVSDTYDVNQMMELLNSDIESVIIKNNLFSEAEFIVGLRKLFSRDIFGMEKYLRWGFDPIQHVVKHSDDRFKFIETMSAYLEELNVSKHYVSRLENVADEFLSNAIFNAPVDKNGQALYHDHSRTESHTCTERERCLFSYAYDGNYFAISMQDHYGTVTKKDIFQGIKRCIEEQGRPDQKAGGAGLGLYMSFLTLNKFIINIRPGDRTEMIGLCNIRTSLKDFNLLDKSLTIFLES